MSATGFEPMVPAALSLGYTVSQQWDSNPWLAGALPLGYADLLVGAERFELPIVESKSTVLTT